MKVLFDFGHPADVHYFKNLISYLKKNGNDIRVLARDKDVTFQLLKAYQIPFVSKGKGGTGLFDRMSYTVKSIQLIREEMKNFNPDICISHASPYLAYVASINKKPHIMFNDTEGAFLFKQVARLFKPKIYCPDTFSQNIGNNLHTFASYMELAYLHPDIFKPDNSVEERIGKNFVLLRFVANKATHDIGHLHLNDNFKRELINTLNGYTSVWISSEDDLPHDLKQYELSVDPSEIHHVISKAKLLIGDGATMCSEAAMLGVPAIFINQNHLGYITELEKKYDLVHHYSADQKDLREVLELAISILTNPTSSNEYVRKRDLMLSDKKNLTEIMKQIVDKTARETEKKSAKKSTRV